MSEQKSIFISGAAGLVLVASTLLACGQESYGATETSTAESELSATESSFEESRATAEACFDTFRGCVEGGGDVDACRATLKECLPDRPPPPVRCGGGHGPRPPAEDGDRPAPPEGEGAPPPSGDPPPPPEGDRPPPPDGDRPPPPEGDRPLPPEGGPPPGGPRCAPPPIPPATICACRDVVESCLEGGGAPAECRIAHDACVRDAFAEHFADRCEHAEAACAEGRLPADACDRISAECAAGLPPSE